MLPMQIPRIAVVQFNVQCKNWQTKLSGNENKDAKPGQERMDTE